MRGWFGEGRACSDSVCVHTQTHTGMHSHTFTLSLPEW